jgi:hypothetical protein
VPGDTLLEVEAGIRKEKEKEVRSRELKLKRTHGRKIHY